MPRVSVIIPVYNSAETLAKALDSVLAQTFTDFEIIAVDDGSTDASRGVLARYGDRVKVLTRVNSGPSGARNAGVAAANGELLAYLDADDLWKPEMLSTMVGAISSAPNCTLAWCDLELIDSAGRPLGDSIASKGGDPSLEDMLTQLWPIMPSAVMIPRWAHDAAGGWPEELRTFEDVYFWLRLREHGPFHFVARILGSWRFAHFPDPLKSLSTDPISSHRFDQMLRERYHVPGTPHVEGRQRAPRSILAYIGLRALRSGDRATARLALTRAIRFDPTRVRNYLRLGRTFLPRALAQALTGGSKRESDRTSD